MTDRAASAVKILDQVPLAKMLESMTTAIIDAQRQLTQNTLDALDRLADSNYGIKMPGETEKRSLLELGLMPSFMHISEATISAKMAFSMAESEEAFGKASAGGSYGMFSASVNAGYASKYSFSVEGSSEFFMRIVSVPPPDALTDMLNRRQATDKKKPSTER
jgi:hypothetical protein